MANEFSRSRRVGEQIRRILAQLLQDEVNDPRIGMVTLTAVQVSKDLSHAKVFFTVLDDDADAVKKTREGLMRASGFLRHELGRQIKLRLTPELHFEYDISVEHGRHLTSLIDSVAPARDAEPELDSDD